MKPHVASGVTSGWDSVDISVILATFGRAGMLAGVLDSLCRTDTEGLSFEVIVVDNAGDDQVASLVRSYSDRLPVVCLTETNRGKNRALLKGIAHARGDLLVFTDDDVVVSPDWLTQIKKGAARYPDASCFGGRILPRFPADSGDFAATLDLAHWFIRSAYVLADWDRDAGARLEADQVWGPNMAIRRKVFDAGISFDPAMGPGTDHPLGDETDLVARAQRAGHHAVYLPDALVYHCVRADQLSTEWIVRRAFMMGRAHVKRGAPPGAKLVLGVPRYLFREYARGLLRRSLSWGSNPKRRLVLRLELEITKGEIAQYRTASMRPGRPDRAAGGATPSTGP